MYVRLYVWVESRQRARGRTRCGRIARVSRLISDNSRGVRNLKHSNPVKIYATRAVGIACSAPRIQVRVGLFGRVLSRGLSGVGFYITSKSYSDVRRALHKL